MRKLNWSVFIALLILFSCSTSKKQQSEMIETSSVKAADVPAQVSGSPSDMKSNPLLSSYNTPFNTVPFDQIKVEHFMPAMQFALAEGRKEINQIVTNTAQPTFKNTIVALEQAGEMVTKVSRVLFHLNSAETNADIQKNVREISPLLTEFSNDISLNAELFKKVAAVWAQKDRIKGEDYMLLEKSYKNFIRNGANLNDADKSKLREINKELSELSIKFSENVLNETNEFQLHITQETDLAGLPEFVKTGAAEAAKRSNKEGWLFTLHAPSYGPFMKYADNRDLRHELFKASGRRGANGNKNDNHAYIERIVKLRYDKAQLLGYGTWADYVLEERMANTKDKVNEFLDRLKNVSEPAAEKEMAELLAFAKRNGFTGDKIERWDQSYYAEKAAKERFSINDELLKPYFKLENVLEGLFTVVNKLFGLTFKENTSIQGWHEDVKAYEVYDSTGKMLAVWYGDYFPRPGKRAGAWNNTLRKQWVQDGKEYRPHVVNVCNFSKPTADKPSLLTFQEVVVLYHEFGHALHDICANGNYASISGTSVPWDFVELPSQMLENFVYQPEVLKLFAKHYQTGEVIPEEYINKVIESSKFMAGMASTRQLSLGMIDMNWHGGNPEGKTVASVEKASDLTAKFYGDNSDFVASTAFSHIFAGGYSAGYYSYKWSEVLDADAFEYFKEKGVFNKSVAKSFYDNILSKGGSEKPMELYKKFRGREPNPDAMLRRSGLLEGSRP
jgi:peptidyl-dipeptidase Dcp